MGYILVFHNLQQQPVVIRLYNKLHKTGLCTSQQCEVIECNGNIIPILGDKTKR